LPPTGSCRNRKNLSQLGDKLAVFDLVGQQPQHERLNFHNSLLLRGAVGHRTRQLRNLGNPSAIVFFFDLYVHRKNMPGCQRLSKRGTGVVPILFALFCASPGSPRAPAVPGTTRALAGGGRRGDRLARRSDSSTFIGGGADDHGRGGRAPRDQKLRTLPFLSLIAHPSTSLIHHFLPPFTNRRATLHI
jgi:hypothetical protein